MNQGISLKSLMEIYEYLMEHGNFRSFLFIKRNGGYTYMWLFFSRCCPLSLRPTSILAKLGIDGVNSNLATAIRTVSSRSDGLGNGISYPCSKRNFSLGRKSWIFLILSGLATGASWLATTVHYSWETPQKVVPVDKLSVVMTLILALSFSMKILPQSRS